jgi:hypothetical protein
MKKEGRQSGLALSSGNQAIAGLFGRHGVERPHDIAGPRQPCPQLGDPGETEIGHQRLVGPAVDEHVLRREITVKDWCRLRLHDLIRRHDKWSVVMPGGVRIPS